MPSNVTVLNTSLQYVSVRFFFQQQGSFQNKRAETQSLVIIDRQFSKCMCFKKKAGTELKPGGKFNGLSAKADSNQWTLEKSAHCL